ncbi:MAG: SPOR domain-containing protein [Thiotrichales bacterium]
MAQYKQRSRRPRANRRNPDASPAMPGWIWLLVGFGMGLLVTIYLVFKHPTAPRPEAAVAPAVAPAALAAPPIPGATVATVQPPPPQTAAPAAKAAAQPAPEVAADPPAPPKYSFYAILPEAEVIVPEAEINRGLDSVPLQQAPGAQPGAGKGYLLQVGSFRNLTDADRRKAELALLGVQATVEKVSLDNTLWHRVRVGPFRSLDDVNRVRTQLHSQQIKTLLVQIAN